jgi:hypothetical protein
MVDHTSGPRAEAGQTQHRSVVLLLLRTNMEAAVISPFLAAPVEDQERLCAALSSILHQCTRGYSSVVPAAVVDKLLQVELWLALVVERLPDVLGCSQVLEDDATSQIARVLAYEILWCVWADDGPIVARVIAAAKKDLKSTGTPDVTLAALDSLCRLPSNQILSFMLSGDVDKTDSLPVIRGKASAVFTSLAFRAWILAEKFVLTDMPAVSFPDALRKRQEVQDRVRPPQSSWGLVPTMSLFMSIAGYGNVDCDCSKR